MNSRIVALGSATVLVAVVSVCGLPAKAHPQNGAPVRLERKDRHPAMTAALHQLEKAKEALEKAKRDFDGHRAKALELTKHAIEEVKAGIASDTR
jgi:uncharacterized protein involved in copper resistance